jgi:hypothetical protein
MTPEVIASEVKLARARGWMHHRDHPAHPLPPIYSLRELPDAITTTIVVTEPDGRTGFLTLCDQPGQALRVLWTEAGTWSADEVRTRTADHRNRYRSTVVAYPLTAG